MRIIHTSDWHLGRRFGPLSLRAEQEAFADWFVELCRDRQAELVVIAGDLFDRAIAPVEAIDLFRDTVKRLLGNGAAVAAITGNHDGADRVAPHGDLLDLSRFYLRGGYHGVGEVIRLDASDGALDLVLLPFLEPQAAPDDYGHDDASREEGSAEGSEAGDGELVERRRRRTHQSVLETACRTAKARLSAPRSIAVAHAFVTGSSSSESERQLIVGGTGDVSGAIFSPFTYTALGHLHRPQAISGINARYSGTPLPYSFSEEHAKSVVVIDMDASGQTDVSTVAVEVGRGVRTVTGTIDQLLDKNRHTDAQDCFVRAIVTDRETVLDAKVRLAEVYPFVTEVRLQPVGTDPKDGTVQPEFVDLAPLDAARLFWEAAEGTEPPAEIDALLVAATASTLADATQVGSAS